jgi:hypothetical protein
MGSAVAQNIILLGGLVVQVATLCYLIKYVRATKGIEEAANQQAVVSRGLLKAANDQTRANQDLMAVANAQSKSSEELARWQPEKWRRDSRGQEWRELIGTLTKCAEEIESAKRMTQAQGAPFAALSKERAGRTRELLEAARVVLRDRLFIRDVVEREKIDNEWNEVQAYYRPLNTDFGNLPDFQQKWGQLHEKLLKAACEDLGMGGGEGAQQ